MQKYREEYQPQQTARITSITIENFKGISKPVTVPLRPITLLFGKNSAGKSTILQAMLYALEAIRTGKADIDTVHLGGDAINLGGFRNLVHKHDLSRTIKLRFDLQLGQFGLESFWMLEEIHKHYANDDYDSSDSSSDYDEDDVLGNVENAYVELELSAPNSQPQITRYTAGIESEPVASIVRIGHSSIIHDINLYHSILRNFDDPLMLDVAECFGDPPDDDDESPYELNYGYPELEIVLSSFSGVVPQPDRPLQFENFEDGYSFQPSAQPPLELFFSRCLVRPVEILLGQLERIRYIGPIRDIPPRNHETPVANDETRWSNGLAAWDALCSAASGGTEETCNLVDKVNDYLRDRLMLGYELRREEVVAVDVNHELFDLLDNLEEGQSQLFQNRYSAFRKYMLSLPSTCRLYLKDLKNGVEVSPSDIGVGVSQVVPVVVGALAKTEKGKQPSIFSIEQPELHIHPAIQCALGDLFIREKSDSRIFLIETHSEHLILRFLRRISETTDNELKDETLSLRPEDLGVAYVNTVDDDLVLTNLPIDEDGEFTVRWPEGFFEERATELFGEPEDA